MGSSVARGAILVALAVALGFVVLNGSEAREQVPLSTTAAVLPSAVAVAPTVETAGVPLPTPTPVIDTSSARPNDQVRILVANGTSVSGQAGRLTDTLRNQGFNTKPAKTANPQVASVIYYRPGYATEARVVQLALGTLTTIAPMTDPDPAVGADIDLADVDVFVLVGDDALANN